MTALVADRVLITGGGAGIGSVIADRCRREGLDVVTIDRRNADIEADLSDVESTRQALEDSLASGPITRVVNNVGAVFPNSFQEQTVAELEMSWALNLRCAFQVTQALLPSMRSVGFGRIVSISSRAALGKRNRSAYSAAKAGLMGLSRVWALELGGEGITSNIVAPGPIATALFAAANSSEDPHTARLVDGIPVGRMGEPSDVANAAWFFLSNESGFVTGQTLYVCGGTSVDQAGM